MHFIFSWNDRDPIHRGLLRCNAIGRCGKKHVLLVSYHQDAKPRNHPTLEPVNGLGIGVFIVSITLCLHLMLHSMDEAAIFVPDPHVNL